MTTPSASTRELVQKYGPLLNERPTPVPWTELDEILRTLRIAASAALEDADIAVLRGLSGQAEHLRNGAEGALWSHETAARHAPDEALHPMYAAACLIDCRRYDEALARLLTARALSGDARSMLAQICGLESEAHHGLGAMALSRAAFIEAERLADPHDATALYRLALHADKVGRKDDALEFFARHVAVVQKIERGDAPALAFLTAAGEAIEAGLRGSRRLKKCFEVATWAANRPRRSPDEAQEERVKRLRTPISLATTWYGEENPYIRGSARRA